MERFDSRRDGDVWSLEFRKIADLNSKVRHSLVPSLKSNASQNLQPLSYKHSDSTTCQHDSQGLEIH